MWQGQAVPLGAIQDGIFDLYCAEYLDHYFVEDHDRKTISFTNDNYGIESLGVPRPGQVRRAINIYPEGHIMIMPFDIPKQASRKPVKVTMQDKSTAEIVSLGRGFMKLRVDVNRLTMRES
jgi:hypothetical protein